MSTFGVYRISDENGVLYVGSGLNPWRRVMRHVGKDAAMFTATHVELTWHPTMNEALEVERTEIARLQPRHNIRSNGAANGRRRADGQLRDLVLAAVESLGDCTSSDVRKYLAGQMNTIHASEVPTVISRLRQSGLLETVGVRLDGYRSGRPQFVVRIPTTQAAAA